MILGVILTFFTLVGPVSLRDQYKEKVDKIVAVLLGAGELKETEKISGHEYYLFDSENGNKGVTVVFSTVKGRFEYFDYMIIINSSLEIINIKILKYRSEYGYEITNKGWLKQFYNKPFSHFEYRKNVDALSGATFSAQSLVNDVNLILDHLEK